MLLEKLIEQHRIDRFVAHGLGLARFISHNQVVIQIRNFLRDQTKLGRRLRAGKRFSKNLAGLRADSLQHLHRCIVPGNAANRATALGA
jgi:hypothetical protein